MQFSCRLEVEHTSPAGGRFVTNLPPDEFENSRRTGSRIESSRRIIFRSPSEIVFLQCSLLIN